MISWYVLLKNPRQLFNILLFFLLFLFSAWAFSLFILSFPGIKEPIASLFVDISAFSDFWLGIAIFLSALIFHSNTKYLKPALIVTCCVIVIFHVLCQLLGYGTQLSSFNSEFNYWQIHFPNKTFGVLINIIYNLFLFTGISIVYIISIKSDNQIKRMQAKIIFYTSAVSFVINLINIYVLRYFYDGLPNYADATTLIFIFGMIYAIYRYRFLQITPSTAANEIIEIIPDCLIITSRNGDVLFVNNAVDIMLKYPVISMLEMNITQLFSDSECNYRVIKDILNENLNNEEAELLTFDDKKIPVLFSSTAIKNKKKQITGFVFLARDNSIRKEYESALNELTKDLEAKVRERTTELLEANFELRQKIEELEKASKALQEAKEKAEESDQLKSAFLSNISHEIRTPMNAIMGLTNILCDSDIEFQERENLKKTIQNNGKYLIKILDDLIDIALIESNQIVIKNEEFLLEKFLNELYVKYLNKLTETGKQIRLSLINDPDLINLKIKTDNNRLYQIFVNLLNNALKFTEKGFIEFGCRKVETKSNILFFIKDSGVGISELKQKYLFQHFIHFANDQLTNYAGNGLGLAISKGLVNKMGGEIWLESRENEGSVFYFTLPCINT
ncbi:MAG: PAS domain-containing protein [Bacteroidales bacterium]|nr:PAS domain-containing protein [Bacteroidales bacterium]